MTFSVSLFHKLRGWAAMGAVLLVGTLGAHAQTATPTPVTVFSDDFSSGKFDSSRWATENDSVHVNRTQFGGTPTFGRDSDGTTYMRVPMDTYNAKLPGTEVKGTEIYSLAKWNLNAGVEWEARIRFPVTTPGWIGGFFSYNGIGIYPDTYQQVENDFEFLTNQNGDQIWTNIWDDWSPLQGGPSSEALTAAPGLNWKDGKWHRFIIRWEPTQTRWYADGQLIRTETVVQPGGAQGVRFNAWLGDPYWPAASNDNLVPAKTSAKNQKIYYDVDSITVRTLPNPTIGAYGTGTGLTGTYFNSPDFTDPKVTRVDSRLNFDWGLRAPDPSLNADGFTVRWEGTVQARFDETYTFSTTSDDGVRLWVNGVQLIDVWQDGGNNVGKGSIDLKAGQRYPIRVEYYENLFGAVIRLYWESPSTPFQLIPQSQLYPLNAPAPTPTPIPTTGPTATPVPTLTPTPVPAPTKTPVPGPTPTKTPVPTATPVRTPTPVPTPTRTPTPSPTPTRTPTPTLAVAFTTPSAGAAIASFSNVTGTYSAATRIDFEIKRQSDKKFWNGWVWQSGETAIPAVLSGGVWKVVAPASNGAGLPTGSNLTNGSYSLEADAYDANGRIVIATRNVTIAKTASSPRTMRGTGSGQTS